VTELEARGVLKLLAAAYPAQRQRMSNDDVRAMAAIYTAGLLDLDADRARAAVNRLVKSSKWIPTIAEIREAAVDVAHGPRSPAGVAWGMARRLSSYRFEEDLAELDPLMRLCLESLGMIKWRELWRGAETIRQWCVCTGDHEVSDRAKFIDLYDQLATGERKEAAIAPGAISKALPQRTSEPRSMRALLPPGLLPEGEPT